VELSKIAPGVFKANENTQGDKEKRAMKIDRRTAIKGVMAAALVFPGGRHVTADSIQRYVRFRKGNTTAYGRLDGETIHELDGSIFDSPRESGKTYRLSDVKLLVPSEPTKILATAGNYASHLGETPKPKNPELFWKAVSALLDPEGTIVIPKGTNDCHYEGELVIVIGKRAKNVSVAEAKNCVFGVTCGNDVSARDWQQNDIQWWRAKAADTFAPVGPCIATGVDYNNLLLTTRLNGEVKQQQRTDTFIYNVEEIVSFVSQVVTLEPGDLIYTGTPGQTSPMKAGDMVEVEIEHIGILRNKVAEE